MYYLHDVIRGNFSGLYLYMNFHGHATHRLVDSDLRDNHHVYSLYTTVYYFHDVIRGNFSELYLYMNFHGHVVLVHV